MNRVARDLLIVGLFVFLARLPFLFHPLQGDDLYYLAGGAHALREPLHPHHAQYVFQGRIVSMAGHPHPPLNAALLGLLLATFGGVSEVGFRGAYSLLMVICALLVYAIARQFTPRALVAALLFAATPVFWVSGNTFESDIPLLTCLLGGIALFLYRQERWASVPLLLSGWAAYQSVVFTPILWTLRRGYGWAMAPVAGVVSYQLWERISTGKFPVLEAAAYFRDYGLQSGSAKVLNAVALTAHLAWLTGPVAEFQWAWPLVGGLAAGYLFPSLLLAASVSIGLVILWRVEGFLGWWVRIFFLAAVVLFFAGAARYLLPLAPPLAILAADRLSPGRAWLAIAAQTALALALSLANMQQWQAYKDFAARLDLAPRTWIAGEWGLRYYLETRGAQPLTQTQAVAPGDLIVESALGFPVSYTTGGGRAEVVSRTEVTPAIPLRLMRGSAWMTTAFGLEPFAFDADPADTITVTRILDQPPSRSMVRMNDPDAAQFLVSGFHQLEDRRYRWMAREAELLLAPRPGSLTATVYRADRSPARRIEIWAGDILAIDSLLQPGLQTLRSAPLALSGDRVRIRMRCDQAHVAPGDARELSLIVQSIGIH